MASREVDSQLHGSSTYDRLTIPSAAYGIGSERYPDSFILNDSLKKNLYGASNSQKISSCSLHEADNFDCNTLKDMYNLSVKDKRNQKHKATQWVDLEIQFNDKAGEDVNKRLLLYYESFDQLVLNLMENKFSI